MKGSINICKASKGVFENFFLKMLIESFSKNANFAAECPQKKGFYYVNNFAPIDNSNLPYQIAVGMVGDWQCSFTIRAKVGKQRSMAEIYSIKLFGSTTSF